MPIINIASSEDEARAKGVNVRPCDANMDGKIILWLYDTHVGLCLEDREENGHDDSDWYMMVWNEEKSCIEKVYFASTRGWTYPCYGSRPDATPEIRAKADEWLRQRVIENAIAADKAQAREIEPGKKVRVVRGRKIPIGSEFVVHHKIVDRYKTRRNGPEHYYVAMLEHLSKPLVWTAESNLEVVNPEQFETSEAEVRSRFDDWKPSTYALLSPLPPGFVRMA